MSQPPYSPAARPLQPAQERNLGLLSHAIPLAAMVLSAGFLGFVASLVMYLIYKDRGPFVRRNAANALNVQITMGLVMLISLPLMLVLVGFATYLAAMVFAVVVHVIAIIKAGNGEWYDPPLTIRFVR